MPNNVDFVFSKIAADFYAAFACTPQIALARSKQANFPLTELTYMHPYHVTSVIYIKGNIYYELEGFAGKIDSDFFVKTSGKTVFGNTSRIPEVGKVLGNVHLLGDWSKDFADIVKKTVSSVTAISADTIKVDLIDGHSNSDNTTNAITLFLHIGI